MKKFNVTKAIANGNIVLGRINDNVSVLFIIGKDKLFEIPITSDGGKKAYFSSENEDEYELVSEIIEKIKENKLFNINKIKLMPKEFTDYDKNISRIEKVQPGTPIVVPSNLKDVLSKNGYVLEEESGVVSKPRDYTELMSNPINQKIFDEDKYEIEAVGATYEGLNAETKIAFESIRNGKSIGILFVGPTGTGKSFTAKVLANKAGAPSLNIQITYGTTIEDLIGQYVPNTGDGPKYIFVEGPLLKAYEQGYQIIIEEINYGQPGIISKLNEFTDGTTRVIVNGITYHRHPNFVVYMTMNPGYEGTEVLNVALKNRFAKVSVPALSKKEFVLRSQLYSKSLGYELSKDFFNKLFDFAAMIEKEASTAKWHENVKFSIRNAQRLCENILQKRRSYDEFNSAISIQYLNDLSTDNDNSEKLEGFKSSTEIQAEIKNLYNLYDFVKPIEKTTEDNLDDLFDEVAEEESIDVSSEEDLSSKEKSDLIGDLLDRFE